MGNYNLIFLNSPVQLKSRFIEKLVSE